MKKYNVTFELTERTTRVVEVEAESPERAQALVEEYEFDNAEAKETGSLEWSVSNVSVEA